MGEKLRKAAQAYIAAYEAGTGTVYLIDQFRDALASVVADKPDAGEVTQEDRDRAAAHIRSQSSHRTDEHFAKLIETGQRDQAPFLRVIAEVRHAAHEAGKRAGMEMGAKVAESHKPLGYMSERERSYCREHGEEITTAIRALSQQETK